MFTVISDFLFDGLKVPFLVSLLRWESESSAKLALSSSVQFSYVPDDCVYRPESFMLEPIMAEVYLFGLSNELNL